MPILAIDIGTSSVRTAVFEGHGRAVRLRSERYSVDYRGDGAAELSPDALLRAVERCCGSSLGHQKVDAVGGSAFWHGLLGLDQRSRAVTPIYTWADSRSAADAGRLREELSEQAIHARTGCMLRAPFWPAKLRWLRRTDPKLFRKVAKWVSPGDWIFAELFGGDRTSESMASGTGLFNLTTRSWDKELCRACGITVSALSRIDAVAGIVDAACRDQRSRLQRRLLGARVFTPIGDGAASNLGCGADEPGFVAINVGTSAAVRTVSDVAAPFGLFRYVVDRTRMVVGGAISNAGNLHEWCLRELRLNRDGLERALRRRRAVAESPLAIIPSWVQERSPDWPQSAGGTMHSLTQSTTAAEIVGAIAASTFYRLADILDLLEASTGRSHRIIVSGGILKSRASVQLLADAIGRDLAISPVPEASLFGAARYAFAQTGVELPARPARVTVRSDRRLSCMHRERRQGQRELQQRITGAT